MEKQMTIIEAYADFLQWALSPEMRNTFSIDNRKYFNTTAKDLESEKCGVQRIKNIFTRFAPGRYEFSDVVVTKTSGYPIE